MIEGVYHGQTFDSPNRVAPPRHSLGMAFGGLLILERQLWRGLTLHAEVGPMAVVYRRPLDESGAQAGSETGAAVSWWLAGGAVWRY